MVVDIHESAGPLYQHRSSQDVDHFNNNNIIAITKGNHFINGSLFTGKIHSAVKQRWLQGNINYQRLIS